METADNTFEQLYPYTLLLLILLVARHYSLIHKQKKSTLLNIFIYLTIVIYFISFFSNYRPQFFMISWFIRDFLIFVITIKLWQFYMNFKRSFFIGILLLAIGLGFLYFRNGSISFTKEAPASFEYDNEAEFLFQLKNKNQLSQINSLLSTYQPEIHLAFPQLVDTLITDLDLCYTIDINDTSTINLLKDTLEKSGLVEWVEYNEKVKLSPIETLDVHIINDFFTRDSISNDSIDNDSISKTIFTNRSTNNISVFRSKSLNDPYIAKLWGFKYMDIDSLNTILKKRKTVKKARIFILDTGVDSEHEDLSGNYISLSEKYDKDTDQHGTHCAGIASAVSNNRKGIASLNLTGDFTSITSITVLPGGSGTQESIIDGIILAADNGADVISMSLGGFSSDVRQKAYEKAIKYANDKGAIVIVAAGNENTNAKNVVPASCKGVIAVSAIDENLQKAVFSNYVTDIEYKVAAPGVNIYSTIPLNQYKSMNGTSMATPYVAGLVGIMKSIEPGLNTEDVFRALISSGMDTKNLEQTGKLIQPFKSISNLKVTSSKTKIRAFMRDLMVFKEQ